MPSLITGAFDQEEYCECPFLGATLDEWKSAIGRVEERRFRYVSTFYPFIGNQLSNSDIDHIEAQPKQKFDDPGFKAPPNSNSNAYPNAIAGPEKVDDSAKTAAPSSNKHSNVNEGCPSATEEILDQIRAGLDGRHLPGKCCETHLCSTSTSCPEDYSCWVELIGGTVLTSRTTLLHL
mmetsp:Transcript_28352/g.34594  ORF Transcript_28352/g.34594 Transcript_28352/m.34594 type:complete len:178 (+) Transcript_28352:3832-4365(+)